MSLRVVTVTVMSFTVPLVVNDGIRCQIAPCHLRPTGSESQRPCHVTSDNPGAFYRPHGSGKPHQFLENLHPYAHCLSITDKACACFCHDKGLRTQVEVVTVVFSPLCCGS